MDDEEKPENSDINNIETKEEQKEILTCDYCKLPNPDLDIFPCNHKICPCCLFRKIFINNIKDVNTKEKIEIKCKCEQGTLEKSIEDIYEINNKKNIIYEKLQQENSIINNNELCQTHNEKNLIYYCINCSEEICELCKGEEKHKEHKIFENEKLVNILKKEIGELKMNFQNKESFEEKWKDICKKLKEEAKFKFNELIIKIEEITKALINFKNLYENMFKQELIKSVKILKLYKLLYFNYYFEKNTYKESTNIGHLRYIFSIPNELSSIEIIKNEDIFHELDKIKNSINSLKLDNMGFTTKINFTKIKRGYKIEQLIEKSHEKLLNGIFELSNNKIMTGSLDFSMKIWEENNNKFENTKKIKGQCGAICSMTKLSNGNIVTTAANNNNINIWSLQGGEDNYVITQSLSSHTKPVLTIAELANGKLISGGLDNSLIIWDKDANGSYLESQRIKDKSAIIKIIPLPNNKFAFTSDNIIRIMLQKKIKKEEEEVQDTKELNDVFDDLDFDKNIESNEDPFIVVYKLSKHVGRIKCLLLMRNGYLISGGSDMAKKKDNNILIWKPNDLDGFFHVQTLEGHKSDINGLIELKDGRLASSSKDRTIRIWKGIIKEDKEKQNVVEFHIDEILNEHKHGIYLIMQLNDERIFSSTSESAIVIWKDNKFLAFC